MKDFEKPRVIAHERPLRSEEDDLDITPAMRDIESEGELGKSRPSTSGAPTSATTETTSSTGGRSKYMSMDFAGSVYLISSDGQMLSLPIPSNSPDDPLTWSFARRLLILTILTVFSALSMLLIQTPGSLYAAFVSDFTEEDMHPLTVEFLASMPTLAMGCSFFVWIPLCVAFGRRPVVIAASLMLTLASLSAGFATGFHPLLVAICFIGFAGGATIGTTLLQIIDLTFIHERPLAIAVFWVIGGFLALVPLGELPSMMDTRSEWRAPFKVASIVAAVISVLILFFVPETYFRRPPVAFDGRVLVQSGTEKVSIYDEWREVPVAADNNRNNSSSRSSSSAHSYRDSSGTMSSTRALNPSLRQRELPPRPRESWLVPPFALWRHSIADPRAAVACFIQVFLCLANPLVFWIALLNAVNFGGMMSIGTGFPVVLAQPPYNLSPQAVGHVNTTAAVSSLLALPAMYAALEGLTRRLTRRNCGVRHAEFYLPAFALPVSTGAASVLLYGCAVGGGWHPVVYHVAYGLNAFSFAAGAIANTVWVTESLPRWAAPGLAVVGGVSYMASWGITAALPVWVKAWGVVAVNVGIGSLMLVVGLLAIPLAFWGKSVRQFIHGRWGASEAGALRPQWRPGEDR